MSKKIGVILTINLLVIIYFAVLLNRFQKEAGVNNAGTWFFNFPINTSPNKPPETVTSQFRADSNRTGNYQIDKEKMEPVLRWIKKPFNSEVHSASKASPAVDDTGVYLGSDTGVMYAFDFDGNVKWSFKTDSDIRGIHGTALLDTENLYFGSYAGYFYSLKKNNGSINWISKIGQAVGSSPTRVGDMIVVSAEFEKPREGHLVALDISTGKLLWKTNYFGEQVHSSPAYDRVNQVFGVGGNNGIFWAFDAATGSIIWQENLIAPIKSTAVAVNDKFCFSTWSKKFLCLDALNGETRLDFTFEGKSQSSAAVLDKDSMIVSSVDGLLYKIDLNDAKKYKSFSLKEGKDGTNYGMSSPIVIKNKKDVYVVSACEKKYICILGKNLELKSKIDIGSFMNGSFTVHKNSLYGATTTGGFFRVDL